MSSITINQEQQLFVIPAGGGYSCRGFRSLFTELVAILARLGLSDPRADESRIGTLEQYEAYNDAIRQVAVRGGFGFTWFHADTPKRVRDVLENARKSGERLRLFFGDTETGRDWLEECDVMGRIGRSGGLMKVPLLLTGDESGGGAILDHCIVRIQRVTDGKVLYEHERYQAPTLAIRGIKGTLEGTSKRYRFEVLRDDEVQARFTGMDGAAAYVAFMLGSSFTQPTQ